MREKIESNEVILIDLAAMVHRLGILNSDSGLSFYCMMSVYWKKS